MTVTCPIRQALARIAPHLETLDPIDRESLRPAVDRLVTRIRDIDARLPK